MDIPCKHCGEPWDMDCIHDIDVSYLEDAPAEAQYEEQKAMFFKYGCGAFEFYFKVCDAEERVADMDDATFIKELGMADLDGLAADLADIKF